MLVLPKAVALRIISAGALSVGLRLAVSPGATRSYSHFPRQTTRSVRNMSTSLDEGPGTSGGTSGAQKEGLREKKKTMRKRIKSDLKAMSEAAVDAGSAAVAERLLACPQLQERSSGEGVEGGGGAVSVYLSMPGELGTAAIVSGLFKLGKKVYIPKVCRRIVTYCSSRGLPQIRMNTAATRGTSVWDAHTSGSHCRRLASTTLAVYV